MVKSGKPIEWRYEFHPRYPYPSPKLVMAESILQSGRSFKKVALIAIIEYAYLFENLANDVSARCASAIFFFIHNNWVQVFNTYVISK